VTQITDFLNNPLVAPLYALLVISLLDLLLGIYRSIQQGAFDWAKIPGVLDSTVLQKFIPLAVLGIASYFVTDGTAKTALEIAYVGGAGAALAGALADLISKATGSFTATTTAQDKGTVSPPLPATEVTAAPYVPPATTANVPPSTANTATLASPSTGSGASKSK